MALEHILLGVLRDPATGYELKKHFDYTLAHFWAAEQSQIYTTLARLERDGLLTSRTEPSDRGPQRKVYSITRKGRTQLRKWLDAGPEASDVRFTYLAQVFFLDELGDLGAAASFLRELGAQFRAKLNALEEVDAGIAAETPTYPDEIQPDLLFPVLTLRLGVRRIRATLDWVDESLAVIERVQRTERNHD